MKRIKKTIYLISLLLISGAAKAQAGDDQFLPKWLVEEWTFLTQGSGDWISDNSRYKNENEPFDAYGIQWEYGKGKKSLRGRLYVIKENKDVGTVWEFRTFYHPKEKKVIIMQFGSDGTYGVGTMTSLGEGKTEEIQEFFNPDGSSSKVAHRSEILGKEHATQSFNILEDGSWEKRRNYVWKLKEAGS